MATQSGLPAGLELRDPRATFAGSSPRRDVVPALALQAGEAWVPTSNPRIRAVMAVDPADLGLTLTLLDAQGVRLGQFTPSSTWLLIPRDRDGVWAVGMRGASGHAVADGAPTFEGLELRDVQGRVLTAIPAQETGAIGRAATLDGGRLATLGDRGLTVFGEDGQLLWRTSSNAHSLKAHPSGRVLALESGDRASQTSELLLLRADGSLIDRFVDPLAARVGLAGFSPDGNLFVVRRFVGSAPARWELTPRRLAAPRDALSSITIQGGVEDALITDDARQLAAQLNVRREDQLVRVVRGMDLTGVTLFDYVLPGDPLAVRELLAEGTRIGIADSEGIQWVGFTDR